MRGRPWTEQIDKCVKDYIYNCMRGCQYRDSNVFNLFFNPKDLFPMSSIKFSLKKFVEN